MNTPNDNKHDKPFVENAKAHFDDSVDRLDAAALSKLNRGRQAALAAASSSGSAVRWQRWMPATGVAAAAVIVVVMLQGPAVDNGFIGSQPTAADFEILIGDDSLEMIEELEFYSWIDLAELDSTDNVS